jgi:hypothetical protein
MTDWAIEADCIWKTSETRLPCQLAIGRPHRNPGDFLFVGEFALTNIVDRSGATGLDVADFRAAVGGIISRLQTLNQAEILDPQGCPIALRSLIPISITDHNGVEMAPHPGHPADAKWNIDRTCKWVSELGATGFRLKFSERQTLEDGDIAYEMSANHPLLGDLVLRNSGPGGVVYFVEHRLSRFAAWHGARLLDENDAPIDFDALANEVTKN